jgi:hypothetical protein
MNNTRGRRGEEVWSVVTESRENGDGGNHRTSNPPTLLLQVGGRQKIESRGYCESTERSLDC